MLMCSETISPHVMCDGQSYSNSFNLLYLHNITPFSLKVFI